MKPNEATAAFAALSQETRLAVLRLLIKNGAEGLPAGAIAAKLDVQPSTLSFHVAALERAGLLKSWRVQRQIFYAPDFEGIRALLTFLMEDCCGGRPEIRGDLFASVQGGCGSVSEPDAPAPARRKAK